MNARTPDRTITSWPYSNRYMGEKRKNVIGTDCACMCHFSPHYWKGEECCDTLHRRSA